MTKFLFDARGIGIYSHFKQYLYCGSFFRPRRAKKDPQGIEFDRQAQVFITSLLALVGQRA
jgi:hypothetical protein